MISLDPRTSALVLIDLQGGIVGRPLAPHSGAAVVAVGQALAERFRAAGALVILVRVAWSDDFGDALRQPVDQPLARPAEGLPPGWSDLVPGLVQPGDLILTKRQWSAFHGTELDLQLRRRGIRTLVLGGVATNYGVESTARQGWELGYEQVVLEDACTTHSAELQALAFQQILPRLARIARSHDLTLMPA